MIMRNAAFFLSLLSLGFLTTNCATRIALTPAPSVQEISEEGLVGVDTSEGVSVTINTTAWTGRPAVKQEITPIKVRIQNEHGSRIRIRYNEFSLMSPSGKHYAALPPHAIDGTVAITPIIRWRDFRVAPYYRSVYPDLPYWSGPFGYDPNYHKRHYGYWQLPLPTIEMREEALPEGTLEDGGEVGGFLYFEKVGKDEIGVTFKNDLVDAGDGKTFGTISIPLLVEQE